MHGDDFTALGTAEGLDKYEKHMCSSFECKLKGRLGYDQGDIQEVRVLNRILHLTKQGLHYEADPRHVEMLAKQLGLDYSNTKSAVTPGVKPTYDKVEHQEEETLEDLVAAICYVKSKTFHVRFSEHVDAKNVPCYSEQYGKHPRHVFLSGPVFTNKVTNFPSNVDRFAGVSKQELEHRKAEDLAERKKNNLFCSPQRRREKLQHVLAEGAAWERQTVDIVAAMSKSSKWKKARVGCKAAKRAELMYDSSLSEQLTATQATEYRALSARANYLAMDRPDICYATKELCRCFSQPTKAAVDCLKRLVRYIIRRPRLI